MNSQFNIYWDACEIIGGDFTDVVAAIQALDGHSRTVIVIEFTGMSIGVGGGADNKVIAYYTRNHWDFFNLAGDPTATGTSELVAGGQPGNYPNKNIVTTATAIEAISELVKGEESVYSWEEQDACDRR